MIPHVWQVINNFVDAKSKEYNPNPESTNTNFAKFSYL